MVGGFADEVKGLAYSISWDADVDDDIPGIVDGQLGRSNLGLLPPMEMEGMVVGVGGF